jgi:hypothetical protein
MLASATCLADHTLTLPLPLCPECNTEMESHPQTYRSRVSYDDAQVRVNNMETTCDTFDDETEETELAET